MWVLGVEKAGERGAVEQAVARSEADEQRCRRVFGGCCRIWVLEEGAHISEPLKLPSQSPR